MSANESKLYTFKEREWVVTGWAEGQMETEREDDKGQKVIVSKYSGTEVKIDDVEYIIVKQGDILATVED